MLHIEITGDCSPKEWGALRALADFMLADAPPKTIGELHYKVTADASEVVGAIRTIADAVMPEQRAAVDPAKLPPLPTAVAVPVPPVPNVADAMIAAEEARVAAIHAGADELPKIVPPPGVKLDTRGFPHDLRIHAATAGTKKDGSWTYKRGVEPELITAVEAELRSVMAAPVPDAPVVTDAAAAFGGGATASDVPTAGTVPPPPVVGATPEPTPTPTPTPTADSMGEFARIMRVVVEKQKAGTATSAVVDEIAKSLGLTGVKDLVKRPDLVPAFEALLP